MRFRLRIITAALLCCMSLAAQAAVYAGRVLDQNGVAVPYATVYPEIAPEWGTATNNDGFFSFEANLTADMRVTISCIGYEKKTVLAKELVSDDEAPLLSVILKEQPIALQETVIAAKAGKQKNKRKQMAALLHAVYVKLEEEFPDDNTFYQVVSDVRMDCLTDRALEAKNSDSSTWGMEQMIADIVVLPEAAQEGRDSVQFHGRFCKRFFDARKRAEADSILASDALERMEQKSKGAPAHFMRRAANAIDSGVVVHRSLFSMGNMRYDFEQTMTDTRHWTVSNESEDETVLTHTQKISRYLGCFQMTYKRHYIVDSDTYAVRRFSEHADVKITIPFGVKLNPDQLQMLNLVNMDDNKIQKFRLRKMRGSVDLNTIYQRQNGHVYTLEKNMICDAYILGTKKAEIPLKINATQRVTNLRTEDVLPMPRSQLTRRLIRQIVEIY